jgi:hypothetical protein
MDHEHRETLPLVVIIGAQPGGNNVFAAFGGLL